MKPLVALTVISALLGVATAPASSIKPGSSAPALDVKTWYKGEPVTGFDKNKTYVVEFWATWCGPCRESIPHLTELAKSNPDVTFVGVSIWEDDNGKNIADFVKQMGDKMDYHVGYAGNQTGMAQTWMAAAGQNGIPTAFVVKDDKIQWIGHPMQLAEPLSEIKSGKYDLAASQAKFDKQQEKNEEQVAVQRAVAECTKLHADGDKARAAAKLADLVKSHPDAARIGDMIRFDWLAIDDPAAWQKQAQAKADSKTEVDLQDLASFAVRDAMGKKPVHIDLDRQAIQLALKAAGNTNVAVLYDAENVYEATKDYQFAMDAAQKFLKVLPNSPYKGNTDLTKMMEAKAKALEAKIKQ